MGLSKEIKDLIKEKQGIHLDVGCSSNKQQGYIGIDMRALPGVDIVHDLENTPWPLPDSCCITVICSHILEHITPKYFVNVMDEIHRVSKPEASIIIASPYGVGHRFVQDPTHCNPINESTLEYFDPSKPLYNVYKPSPFRIQECGYHHGGDIHAILRVIKNG